MLLPNCHSLRSGELFRKPSHWNRESPCLFTFFRLAPPGFGVFARKSPGLLEQAPLL